MNLVITYRLTAVATWSIAVLLFCLGLAAKHPSHQRDFYAFGFLGALIGATAVVLLAQEVAISRAVRREVAISRACLAESIADALADELEKRGIDGDDGPISRIYPRR